MARFSNSVQTPTQKARTPDVINAAGGTAFKHTDDMQLISLLANSFCTPSFHTGSDGVDEIIQLITSGTVDSKFAAKAAIYARDQLNMRSITHVAAAAICDAASGQEWLDDFLYKVVSRPDDMSEIIAVWLSKISRKGNGIPSAMKRGFARAFTKFDDYQIGKYKMANRNISLFDVINLVHPKTTSVDALKKGTLAIPETWETKLSSGADKAQVWKELLASKKLGYMAALRNIRNIAQQADDETYQLLMDYLVNQKAVLNSKQLPFRFYTASKTIAESDIDTVRKRNTVSAISKACDISIGNFPSDFTGRTLIALDTSGSMQSKAAGGDMTCVEAGGLIAASLYKAIPGSEIMVWASGGKIVVPNPDMPIIAITQEIQRAVGLVGHGTDISQVFINAPQKYDRIIIISDMQCWVSNSIYGGTSTVQFLAQYNSKFDANPWIHNFDLAHYGTSQFPTDPKAKAKVTNLFGYSDKVIDMLLKIEQGPDVMLNTIKSIEL